MKYSEIFYSIQGEGQFVGVPSVFFRTSLCNLRCNWCDTPYTSWQPENKTISVDQAFAAIHEFDTEHVVITGGEPFVQKNELGELCEMLFTQGHYITIETNATLFAPVQAHLISMSPKLAHSVPQHDPQWHKVHDQERLKPQIIQQFLENYSCQVKFVVDAPQDIEEIKELQDQIPIPKQSIVLMPQSLDQTDIFQRQKWLVELCKNNGYRYSPRLHVDIWGNQRGT